MKSARLLCAALVLAAAGRPCRGQFIRPPVVVPRLPVHSPVHVPHVPGVPGHRGGGQAQDDVLAGVIMAFSIVAIVGGAGFLIHRWRQRSRRPVVIRITAAPPGEAPEFVRRAWVGLELPLVAGQARAERLPAQGVLSRRDVYAPPGYAVDGKTAVSILQESHPEVAWWWLENAPDVVAPGYQLVFPAEVCQTVEGPGA
jgi:hypothetical protein